MNVNLKNKEITLSTPLTIQGVNMVNLGNSGGDLEFSTSCLCIVDFGALKNSTFMIKKMLRFQNKTIIIPKACI